MAAVGAKKPVTITPHSENGCSMIGSSKRVERHRLWPLGGSAKFSSFPSRFNHQDGRQGLLKLGLCIGARQPLVSDATLSSRDVDARKARSVRWTRGRGSRCVRGSRTGGEPPYRETMPEKGGLPSCPGTNCCQMPECPQLCEGVGGIQRTQWLEPTHFHLLATQTSDRPYQSCCRGDRVSRQGPTGSAFRWVIMLLSVAAAR
jgi:hypothetical protein